MSFFLIQVLAVLVPSIVLLLASCIALRVPIENPWAQQREHKSASRIEKEELAINWMRLLWMSLLLCVGMTTWLLLRVYGDDVFVMLLSLLLIIGVMILVIQRIPTRKILLPGVFIAILFAWMASPNWLSANVLAVTLIVCCLVGIQLRSAFYEVAFVLGTLALLYDAVNVFVTDLMMKGVEQSLKASNAVMLVVPASLDLGAPIAVTLGIGDVVFPGLLVVVAGRIAQRTAQRAIYFAAITGLAVGLFIAGLATRLTHSPQPTLIYLIPSITVAVWLAAKQHGLQNELRRRMKRAPIEK